MEEDVNFLGGLIYASLTAQAKESVINDIM